MKLTKKTISVLLLMFVMALGVTDVAAQSRKGTARKGTARKTATTKKRAAAAKPAGPALSKEKLTGNKLVQFFTMPFAGSSMDMFSELTLRDESLKWDFYGDEVYVGDWSVTGNTLKAVTGSLTVNAASADGGKTFKGKFSNGSDTFNAVLYNVTKQEMTPDEVKSALQGGKYLSYITLYRNGDPELGFPVTVKFTPNGNGDGGSYRVSGDHKVMTALGVVKGKYTFTDDNLVFDGFDGKAAQKPWGECNNYFYIDLGPKSIPGMSGRRNVFLYFIKK